MTVMISSHLLHEVEMLANRMVIIDKGKVIVEGHVKELLSSDDMKVTIGVDDTQKAKIILDQNGFNTSILKVDTGELTMQMSQSEVAVINSLLIENGIQVNKIIPVRSLEDYFLSLT